MTCEEGGAYEEGGAGGEGGCSGPAAAVDVVMVVLVWLDGAVIGALYRGFYNFHYESNTGAVVVSITDHRPIDRI
jgi:hypothetical protein